MCTEGFVKHEVSDPSSGRLAHTIDETADLLSVSRSTIYRLIERGELVVIRIGTAPGIPTDSLRRFVDAKTRAARLGRR